MRVTVVSTIASQPPMIGDEPPELRSAAIRPNARLRASGSSRYHTQQLPEHQTAAVPKGNDSVLEN